jgi:predicted nucleic acid-binding protein
MTLDRFVIDTNIALYLLGDRLNQSLPLGVYFVSFITEMELLSYPELTDLQAKEIHRFLNDLTVVNLDDEIKNMAIEWRKRYRLKLPDAIIAATSLSLGATLLTNDQQLLKLQDLPTQSLAISL